MSNLFKKITSLFKNRRNSSDFLKYKNNYFDEYSVCDIDCLHFDQNESRLSFKIIKTTYKPKIEKYIQKNYIKTPIYSTQPSITTKIEFKFNQRINVPLFCEEKLKEMEINLDFKYHICNFLNYEPKWVKHQLKIVELKNEIKNLNAEIVKLKEKTPYKFKPTDYNEEQGNFWLRFFFAFFTFGLSFIGYNSKQNAVFNKQINSRNTIWNENHKKHVDRINKEKEIQIKEKEELINLKNQQIDIENFHIENARAECDCDGWINIRESLKFNNNELKEQKGIYIIWNKNNNKYYVGQTKNLYKRIFNEHFSIASNDVKNITFAKDWYANHEFFYKYFICETKDELDSLEKKYIELYDSFNNGYNKTNGNK